MVTILSYEPQFSTTLGEVSLNMLYINTKNLHYLSNNLAEKQVNQLQYSLCSISHLMATFTTSPKRAEISSHLFTIKSREDLKERLQLRRQSETPTLQNIPDLL